MAIEIILVTSQLKESFRCDFGGAIDSEVFAGETMVDELVLTGTKGYKGEAKRHKEQKEGRMLHVTGIELQPWEDGRACSVYFVVRTPVNRAYTVAR